MKNNKVFIVFIGIIAFIVIVLILTNMNNKTTEEVPNNTTNDSYYEVQSDGTKVNTSEEFNSNKKYKDLEITNIHFSEKDGKTQLLADVKNTGTEKHESEIVKITILDANNETIVEINPIIGDIEAGETIELIANVTADVVNAKDFKIESK